MSETMELAFSPESDLRSFLVKWLPKLVKEYGQVADFTEIDPIISIWLKEEDLRYSVQFFRNDQCVVEEREMIDFPLFTIAVERDVWDRVCPFLRKWVPSFIERLPTYKGAFFLSRKMFKELERIDATIDVTLLNLGGVKENNLPFQLILNDYVSGKKGVAFSLSLTEEGLWELLNGDFSLAKLTQEIRVVGDLGLSARLGHILTK